MCSNSYQCYDVFLWDLKVVFKLLGPLINVEIQETGREKSKAGRKANRKDEFCPRSGPSTFALSKDPYKVWFTGGGGAWKKVEEEESGGETNIQASPAFL